MSASPAAVAVLEYGRLLYDRQTRAGGNQEAMGQAEIQALATLEKDKAAQAVFGNGKGRPLDPLAVRVLSHVAYVNLCTSKGLAVFGDVVRASAGEEPSAIIAARQAVASLLLGGQLAFRYGGKDCLQPGSTLLEYLAGGPGALPLVPTENWVREERHRAEQAASKKTLQKPLCLPTAKQLAKRIAEHVVGLDGQIRTVACRLALHLRRAAMLRADSDPGSPNESLLLIGPSSCGKTYLAETAGRVCGLPFTAMSATDLTCEGYVGLSVDDAVRQLVDAANNDHERARYGMLLFDEFDKKRSSGWEHGGRDVAGASVQQAVLRLVEGTDFQVGGRKGSLDWCPITFNSRGTCFLFAGAFVGLDRKVREQNGMGFGAVLDTGLREGVLYDALEGYGMIPEFLNRLTGVLVLPTPTIDQLVDIARRCVLPSYNRVLATCQAEVRMDDPALRLLAGAALDSGTLARGLKTVLSRLVERIVYDEVKGKVVLTPTEVREALEAVGLQSTARAPTAIP